MGFLENIYLCLCQAVGMNRPDVISFCNSQHVSSQSCNVYPTPQRADNSVLWIIRGNFKILHPKPRPRKIICVVNRLWDYFVHLLFHQENGSSYFIQDWFPSHSSLSAGSSGSCLVSTCASGPLPSSLPASCCHFPQEWAPSPTGKPWVVSTFPYEPKFLRSRSKTLWLEVRTLSSSRPEFKTWFYCFIIGSSLEKVARVLYLSLHI